MSPRTGRRPGDQDTRREILDAARHAFGELGFSGATIRTIAGNAGVDPALVLHYFGSKADLFATAVHVPGNAPDGMAAVAGAPVEGLGQAMARAVVDTWEDPDRLDAWLGLLRSAMTDERAAAMLREHLAAAILAAVAERVRGDDAALRVSLAASQVIGLSVARYVVRLEPLASVAGDALVASIAPVLQHCLVGDVTFEAQPG